MTLTKNPKAVEGKYSLGNITGMNAADAVELFGGDASVLKVSSKLPRDAKKAKRAAANASKHPDSKRNASKRKSDYTNREVKLALDVNAMTKHLDASYSMVVSQVKDELANEGIEVSESTIRGAIFAYDYACDHNLPEQDLAATVVDAFENYYDTLALCDIISDELSAEGFKFSEREVQSIVVNLISKEKIFEDIAIIETAISRLKNQVKE